MCLYPLEKLRTLSRAFDLFEPGVRDWAPLVASGLVPPLPVAGDELVWGFPLLEAAERSGLCELACVELASGGRASHLEAALRLENRRGAYSLSEQARVYGFLARAGMTGDPEKLTVIAGLLTAQAPAAWLKTMGEFVSLPDGIGRLVAEDVLDLKTASRVRSLSGAFFERLEREKSRFSFSERREISLLLWEISRRDRLTRAATESLADELFSLPDPRPRLRVLRYPEYTKLAGRLAGLTAGLDRDGIAVRPPDGFEGDEFFFSFTAASPAVYARRLAALKNFEDEIDRLFELL
ncbi:MAG: hypothetical protein JXD23_08225 [Spirochaetales bacterium]|nr:hypothetical protein [Spirochaetales bacterium]